MRRDAAALLTHGAGAAEPCRAVPCRGRAVPDTERKGKPQPGLLPAARAGRSGLCRFPVLGSGRARSALPRPREP